MFSIPTEYLFFVYVAILGNTETIMAATEIADFVSRGIETTASISNSTSSPTNVTFVMNVKLACFALVICVGFLGSCTNATVLGAFLLKNQAKTINKLIVNQLALDLFASVSLLVSYSTKVNEFFYLYPDNTAGAILCKFVANGVFPFWGLTGSIIGLVILTLERYFKIVHPFGYRKYYSSWMTRAGIILAWSSGFMLEICGTWTSQVKNGKCLKFYFWAADRDAMTFSVASMVIQYFLPLVIFFYGYGSILAVIRRRPDVPLRLHGPGIEDLESKNNGDQIQQRIQIKTVKMLITVTVAFIVCCSPNQIYDVLIMFQVKSLMFPGMSSMLCLYSSWIWRFDPGPLEQWLTPSENVPNKRQFVTLPDPPVI